MYLDKSSSHALGEGAEFAASFWSTPATPSSISTPPSPILTAPDFLVEELTVASLIHTISTNTPGILRVKILVDGKERDTLAGHADLSEFYDVTAVNQLAVQLQPTQ